MSDEVLNGLLGIVKIITPIHTTEVVCRHIYTVEYTENYYRGLNGDWEKPKPRCHTSIWGWVTGLKDGGYL